MKRIITTLSQKWPEYLLEILVITFGILGAFALNSWNESNKTRRIEKELLVALHHDLGENMNAMKSVIAFDSTIYARLGVLIDVLDDEKSTYHDSLKFYFGYANRVASFDPQRLAYESIKSIGFNVISDPEVRNKVIGLYDQYYSQLKLSGESQYGMFLESSRIFFKHLRGGETPLEKIPNDFDALKKDNEFKNLITTLRGDMKSIMGFHKSILRRTAETRELLESKIEIDSL